MKITVDLAKLSLAAKALTSASFSAPWDTLWFADTVMATDGSQRFEFKYDFFGCPSVSGLNIGISIPALVKILPLFTEPTLNIRFHENFANFEQGRSIVKMATVSPEERPDFPKIKPTKVVSVTEEFIEKILSCSSMCGSDKYRPILNGVHFNGSSGILEATDGVGLYRTFSKLDGSNDNFIIPNRLIKHMRLVPERIGISETALVFYAENVEYSCGLLDGAVFPDTDSVLNSRDALCRFKILEPISSFLSVVNSLISKEESVHLFVREQDIKFVFRTATGTQCEKTVPAEIIEGDPGDFRINPKYLKEWVDSAESCLLYEHLLKLELSDGSINAIALMAGKSYADGTV